MQSFLSAIAVPPGVFFADDFHHTFASANAFRALDYLVSSRSFRTGNADLLKFHEQFQRTLLVTAGAATIGAAPASFTLIGGQ